MPPLLDLQLLWPILLFGTPLLVAAVGELVVERAGMVNISIEGMMLAGALGAWLANAYLGPAGGIFAGILAALLLGLLYAAVTLLFSADQIVTGTGINLLALGLTGLIYRTFDPLVSTRTLTVLTPRYLVLLMPLLLAAIFILFRHTRYGLELAAIGHAPAAADTAGIPVNRRKLHAILFGSACAGLAGTYLSTMRTLGFNDNMTEGQGFLALAIVIFGRWNALGILLAGLFFGLIRAYADRLIVSGTFSPDTSRLLNMLPYVISLLALATLSSQSRAPAALGKAYVRH